MLGRSEEWQGDGTFDAAPALFAQLYSLHGDVNGSLEPLVLALLLDKSQVMMVRLFRKVSELFKSVGTLRLLTDFEMAAMNAAHEVFPASRRPAATSTSGRHIQQDQQALQQYQASDDNKVLAKMLPALAFVPLPDVVAAFELLAEWLADQHSWLSDVVDGYFEPTYIGAGPRRRNQLRCLPRFGHEKWNMYERVVAARPRTNNKVECFHQGMSSSLAGCNPTIWRHVE